MGTKWTSKSHVSCFNQRAQMLGSEPKWTSTGNQDMIASISYGIPKQSQGKRLKIKHKRHANKLKFNKNMQKFPMLIFMHQNRIPAYIENILELYENERTCILQKSYMCYSLPDSSLLFFLLLKSTFPHLLTPPHSWYSLQFFFVQLTKRPP